MEITLLSDLQRHAPSRYDQSGGRNADQSIVWMIDDPISRVKHGMVWCSLNRVTGEFVGWGGKHPGGVSVTGGFPLSR